MSQNDILFHPGEVLCEVYMKDLKINQSQLADLCRCSPDFIESIIRGENSISPAFALNLERVLGTSAEMWLKMQVEYDHWLQQKKNL